MVTISKENNVFTLVNVFAVTPEKQNQLLDFLIQNTDEFISKCPGFISASFLKSFDGKSVVAYAQYTNIEAFQNMIQTAGGQTMVQQGSIIAESAQRNLCSVYATREAAIK